jgi:hypothetical protein
VARAVASNGSSATPALNMAQAGDGERIIAGLTTAGGFAPESATWPVWAATGSTPTLRSFEHHPVSGQAAQFAAVMSGAGAWVMTGVALTPVPALAVTLTELPTALAGQRYGPVAVTTAGGTAPREVTASGLPAGITLAYGVLNGTPEQAGTAGVTLAVTDADGFTASVTLPLIVYARPAPAPPPWVPAPPGAYTRRYDLAFDRRYLPVPVEPPGPPGPPRPPGAPALVPIRWDGLNLQQWEPEPARGDWFTAVVTLVTGWYASPPLDGHNVPRALSDGEVLGRKLLGARVIIIEGAAVGPPAQLMAWRDQLAHRAAARVPAELAIGDVQLGTTLTAMVRADTELMEHEFWAGPRAFRYQVTVTATDPLLYGEDWHQVVLTTETAADAGRRYFPPPQWPRRYDHPPPWADPPATSGWGYASPYPAGSAAYLANRGNADAPVFATYSGDLGESRLTDEASGQILLEPVPAGVQILVATATLVAEAPGGAPRAEWVLPGSRPLVIPGFSTVRWHLYSLGSGRVTLAWRDAWT